MNNFFSAWLYVRFSASPEDAERFARKAGIRERRPIHDSSGVPRALSPEERWATGPPRHPWFSPRIIRSGWAGSAEGLGPKRDDGVRVYYDEQQRLLNYYRHHS